MPSDNLIMMCRKLAALLQTGHTLGSLSQVSPLLRTRINAANVIAFCCKVSDFPSNSPISKTQMIIKDTCSPNDYFRYEFLFVA